MALRTAPRVMVEKPGIPGEGLRGFMEAEDRRAALRATAPALSLIPDLTRHRYEIARAAELWRKGSTVPPEAANRLWEEIQSLRQSGSLPRATILTAYISLLDDYHDYLASVWGSERYEQARAFLSAALARVQSPQ